MRFVCRALTPEQELEVRRATAIGVTRRQLAAVYGVHPRTIARTLRRSRQETIYRVEVAGYHATFVVDEDGPVQRTGWLAVVS